MRGRFVRADGLTIDNNISIAGSQAIMKAAFRHDVQDFFVGLCQGVPTLSMTVDDVIEPTIGINGYARQQLTQDIVGWPSVGVLGSEAIISSKPIVFTPTASFDQAFSRLMLVPELVGDGLTSIFALSVALSTPIVLTSTTPLIERTFTYEVLI